MIDLQTPVDRAFLVGAPDRDLPKRLAEEHLEELARLTDTAGGQVVGTLSQRIARPHPRFYIGDGKAHALAEAVRESEADLVVFDEDLSPAQGKNLEELLDVRVMDRSELILDIFATRARSKEARMQVELAQLEYLLPRLRRMWNHLSRIRGGIGLRGPGETQLETDRRMIGTRIGELRRKLRDVAKARAVQRKSRAGSFRAALVGYTNAGKSSLLRALSGTELFVEDRLFATLDSATRSVALGSGHEALVTDTVGFIRKLPHDLVASFRSTLEEAGESDVLIHVIDASHSDWEEHFEVVDGVLEELGLAEHDRVLVFNKIDRLTHAEEEALRERIRALEPIPAVFLSALRPETLGALRDTLRARVLSRLAHVVVSVPVEDGEAIASLYREGEVVARVDDDTTVAITARVPAPLLGRLAKRTGVTVEDVE
ncbi:MAG: GTPase HflX [Gemmatimonadota bacterium]|nr:GTPase HflX [Gemmatimonadota bacterium]MDH3422717.1 GTPase HflX [Gemmatimonadota bacterium]